MPRPLRVSCFSFFSLRLSLSVLPDFFDATFRGDLSAMSTPFLRGILLPFGGHGDTGREMPGLDRHLTTTALPHSDNMVNMGAKLGSSAASRSRRPNERHTRSRWVKAIERSLASLPTVTSRQVPARGGPHYRQEPKLMRSWIR